MQSVMLRQHIDWGASGRGTGSLPLREARETETTTQLQSLVMRVRVLINCPPADSRSV